jgi:hypothetical protein
MLYSALLAVIVVVVGSRWHIDEGAAVQYKVPPLSTKIDAHALNADPRNGVHIASTSREVEGFLASSFHREPRYGVNPNEDGVAQVRGSLLLHAPSISLKAIENKS